jgi:hypothetical protein
MDNLQPPHLSIFWQSLLREYTKAKLTYTKDRLVAISGIAKRFQKRTKDEWIAGLWKSDSLIQICWHVDRIAGSYPRRLLQYQVPSWSWASVEGSAIKMLTRLADYSYRFYSHIRDVQVVATGADVFGEVCHGNLRLQCGPMLRGTIMSLKSQIELNSIGAHNIIILQDEAEKLDTLLYLTVIFKEVTNRNQEIVQFQRVGKFKVEPGAIEAFESARKAPEYTVPESFYAGNAGTDEDGQTQYIIDLI